MRSDGTAESYMFTGIVEAIGTVETVQGSRISIRTPWDPKQISLGQSISVHGCCLTVVDIQNQILSFDVSDETFQKTFFKTLQPKQKLNLERAMEMGSRFDGHCVTGHVDMVGTIQNVSLSSDQSSKIFVIGGLKSHQLNVVPKGSIAIDGVSLTVNEVTRDTVSVCIIPYTSEHTCFSKLSVGDSVNIEFDVMGKYVMKYIEQYKQHLGASHADKN